MAFKRAKRNYTLAISQEDLEHGVEALAPLSSKQEAFIACESSVVLWAGGQNSGKSFLCLLDLLSCATDDKHFTATITRESLKKVKQSGGLWDTSWGMFKRYGASANSMELSYSFPNGARVKFNHLNEGNIDAFQGSNNTRILVDEAAENGIEEDHISYLITRLRGRSQHKKQIKLTGNPRAGSFLKSWLEKGGYIDHNGYHLDEMDGVERLMVLIAGTYEFFETKEQIEEKYGKDVADQAITFTSFNANIFANPVAMADPFNLHTLKNLKEHEVQRLLYGCWAIDESGASFLKREMFEEIPASKVPMKHLIHCRAWDLASTPVGESDQTGRKEMFPDATVGIHMAVDPEDSTVYILDLIHMKESSAIVVDTIVKTAKKDGKDVYTVIPQDSGSAGKMFFDYMKTRLMKEAQAKVIKDQTSKSKLQRAEPFIVAAQEMDKIKVVAGVFQEHHWKEIIQFSGERSSRHYKDDIVDALATGYNTLTQGHMVPTIKASGIKEIDRNRLRNLGGRTLI